MRAPFLVLLSPLLLVALAGCGHTEEEWTVKIHEIQALNAKLARASQGEKKTVEDTQRMQEELAALRAEVAAGGRVAEASRITAEQRYLQERVAHDREQLELARARFDSLRKKLEGVEGVDATVRHNLLTIILRSDVTFDGSGAELSARGRETVRKVGEAIASDPGLAARSFEVVGHSDKTGKEEYAVAKSFARASTVREIFVSKRVGLSPGRVAAIARGSLDPLVDDESAGGRATNRRIEVVLVPDAAELTDISALSAPSAPPPSLTSPGVLPAPAMAPPLH